jgi:hypothetical protein
MRSQRECRGSPKLILFLLANRATALWTPPPRQAPRPQGDRRASKFSPHSCPPSGDWRKIFSSPALDV